MPPGDQILPQSISHREERMVETMRRSAPSFVQQALLDDVLRARLRDAHLRRFGFAPTAGEIEVMVRKEFAQASLRMRGSILGGGAPPSPTEATAAEATERATGPGREASRLGEAQAAIGYADAQGIDSLLEAVRWYHAHRDAFESAPDVVQCVDEFLCVKRGEGCAPVTLNGYRSKLDRFAHRFRGRRPAEITPREIGGWIVSHGAHPRTRLDWWQTLRTFFGWCQRMRLVPENPVPLAMAKPKPPRGSQLVLTPTEVRRILRLVRDTDELGFWALSLFAGLRTEEIRRLQRMNGRWNLVRLRSGVIDIPAEVSKAYSRRVPILPVLRPWLELVASRRLPFFPPSHYVKCRRVRNRVLAPRTNPLDEKHYGEQPAVRAPIWAFNISRRTYISYRLASGDVNYAELSHEVGNSEAMLRQHYVRHVTQADAKLFFALTPDRL